MYEEEKIFGPFTFRQFIYLSTGLGFVYIVREKFPEYAIFGFVIMASALVSVFLSRPKKINMADIPEYLKTKRIQIGEVEHKKWLRRKIAGIQVQIMTRKEKGLMVDKNLENLLRVYKIEVPSSGIGK